MNTWNIVKGTLLLSGIIIILSCECPLTKNELIEPNIRIISNLEQDMNGYHHLYVVRSNQQTLHRISLETNFDQSTRVEWSTTSSWVGNHLGQEFEVPIINHISYTSPEDGTAQTIFAPVVELISDTVMVVVTANGAIDEIQIILE